MARLAASRTRGSDHGDLGSHWSIAQEAELHVLGGEGVSVVELQPLAQLEVIDPSVRAEGPRLREARRSRVAGHGLDERVMERIADPERLRPALADSPGSNHAGEIVTYSAQRISPSGAWADAGAAARAHDQRATANTSPTTLILWPLMLASLPRGLVNGRRVTSPRTRRSGGHGPLLCSSKRHSRGDGAPSPEAPPSGQGHLP
jgi:hypothetical protein